MLSRLSNRFCSFAKLGQSSHSSFHCESNFHRATLNRKLVFKNLTCFKEIHSGHQLCAVAGNYGEVSEKLQQIPQSALFDKGLEIVKRDLIGDEDEKIADAVQWSLKVFDYNVREGKKVRGALHLKAYCSHAFDMNDDAWLQTDSEGWRSAAVLAWCIEMLQAFLLIADDVMDGSMLRRGKPCWYKLEDVGLCAVNDCLLLNAGIYKLLKKHFAQSECYINILHEFLQVSHKTMYGQCLDMCNPPNKGPCFELFTTQRYHTLVENKTSHYTFCLPVHLAMHLVGNSSPEDFNVTRNLCLKLGLYYQSQDDYLDAYGDQKVTGKFGNDICEGKCTWLAVKFLELASDSMKKEFKEYYGKRSEDSGVKVMELYNALSMAKEFQKFEDNLGKEIMKSIEDLDASKGGLFYNIFSIIRKREK